MWENFMPISYTDVTDDDENDGNDNDDNDSTKNQTARGRNESTLLKMGFLKIYILCYEVKLFYKAHNEKLLPPQSLFQDRLLFKSSAVSFDVSLHTAN